MTYPASYTGRPAAEMELEHRANMDAAPLVVRCARCPGWSIEGPAGLARVGFQEHLLLEHPEVHPVRRKRGGGGTFAKNVSVWRDDQSRAEAMALVAVRLRTTHYDEAA